MDPAAPEQPPRAPLPYRLAAPAALLLAVACAVVLLRLETLAAGNEERVFFLTLAGLLASCLLAASSARRLRGLPGASRLLRAAAVSGLTLALTLAALLLADVAYHQTRAFQRGPSLHLPLGR